MGGIRVQFIHQRVYFWDGVEECAKLWHRVAHRTLDIDGQPDAVLFTISNTAAEVPAARVVAMACARYFIERGLHTKRCSDKRFLTYARKVIPTHFLPL
jgi:hypothetical protein